MFHGHAVSVSPVTIGGQVGGLDTSSYNLGQELYLGNNGQYDTVRPTDGDYSVIVGVVDVVHPTEGIITVDIHVSDQTVEATVINGMAISAYNDTSMHINTSTRVFTISASTEFHYYVDWDKFEISSGVDSIVFPDTEGRVWIYYDKNGLNYIIDPTDSDIETIILNYVSICASGS